MSRTRLELGSSGSIDLMDDVPYSLNYAIADIRDPSLRNASYSKTLKVPGSKQNNQLFAHIFEIGIDCNFNPNLKTPFKLYIDELLQMQGFLQLLKINKRDENEIIYEVALRGNVGNIFTEWGEKELTDLDLSAYNHTYNKVNQKASWTNPVGAGIVYPMIDYGLTNGLTFSVENFYPAIYVKQYIDSFFALAGYTYSSTFFNSDFFKRLIIPYNATTMLLSETELTSRYFKAKRNANYIAKTLVSSADSAFLAYTTNAPVKIQIDTDISDVSNQFNTSTFEATILDKGTYIFNSNINFNLSFSGLTVSPSTLPFDFVINFGVGIFNNAGALITTLGTGFFIVPSQTISNGGTTATYNISFTTPQVLLLSGQKVATFFSLDSILLNQPGSININILANSTFENKAINTTIFDGDTLTMNDMALPRNVKIKDFFTSIIKMFNLYIESDKTIEKKLFIEPRNDFYAGGSTIDWTDKLSVDRVMDIEPMGDLNASRYTFKYKEDKDYWNGKYQTSYLETYGQRNKDVATDFIKSTKNIDIIFSPTPLAQIGGTDRIISQIVSMDNSGSLADVKNSNLRILYFKLKQTQNSWQYTGTVSGTTTETDYAYAGHVDEPLLPTLDLSFGVPQQIFYDTTFYTNNNLYNKFYKKYIEEITDKDSKIIRAFFYLTPLDIFLLDFRNQFFVDGNLLRLNKVYDYNPLGSDLTKCEFIKIKDALPFVPQVGLGIYGNDIAYETGENAPGTNIGISPYLGNIGSLGIATGNIVETTATSINVTGFGNYVGGGTNSISILSSSGVTVMPNISNVTLINSSNVTVTQSNTTWINGVEIIGNSSEQGIVAYPGGGQVNAYQTSKKFNLIETCATAGDSVKTIFAVLDAEQTFKNVGIASMTVYPKPGEQFRRGTVLLGADVGYPVASRNTLRVYCYEPGIWTD
jgi:hypothetical protein